MQNIALTSGTDQVEAINFDPNNRFSDHFSANYSESKDQLLPYQSVTNDQDNRVDGGTVVGMAQMSRKLFLAHRELLIDVDGCHTDLRV